MILPILDDKNDLIKSIANTYHTLMIRPKLKDLLCYFIDQKNLDQLSKYELHMKIDNLIFNNYKGEQVIKYLLAKEFLYKEVIGAFEMKVNQSRLDFIIINNHTASFEIKTANDDLRKLDRQVSNYSTVFNYNYVVLHEKHINQALSQLDERIGIWLYEKNRKVVVRKARHNKNLDPREQLALMTHRELQIYFSPNCQNIEYILNSYSPNEINSKLKEALKKRYMKRWNFIMDNWSNILSCDLQFFFNTNVKPDLIYQS